MIFYTKSFTGSVELHKLYLCTVMPKLLAIDTAKDYTLIQEQELIEVYFYWFIFMVLYYFYRDCLISLLITVTDNTFWN